MSFPDELLNLRHPKSFHKTSGMELRRMLGKKKEAPVRGGESVLASRFSRETIDQKKEAHFLKKCEGGCRPISWTGGSRGRSLHL